MIIFRHRSWGLRAGRKCQRRSGLPRKQGVRGKAAPERPRRKPQVFPKRRVTRRFFGFFLIAQKETRRRSGEISFYPMAPSSAPTDVRRRQRAHSVRPYGTREAKSGRADNIRPYKTEMPLPRGRTLCAPTKLKPKVQGISAPYQTERR